MDFSMYSDLLGLIFFNCPSAIKSSWLLYKAVGWSMYHLHTGIHNYRYTWMYQETGLEMISMNTHSGNVRHHQKKFIMPIYKIKCHHSKFWSFVLKDENLSKNLRLSQATWITFSCCFRTTNIKIFNPLACNNVPDVWSY